MDVIAERDTSISVNYGGEAVVIPDVDSVKYSILDHVGQELVPFIDIPVVTSLTSHRSVLFLPSAALVIDPIRLFERRYVFVSFLVNGVAQSKNIPIRIVPWVGHAVTPEKVRSFCGVSATDLPNEDIDIFSAYISVATTLGHETLGVYLASGTAFELAANDMICMKAVLDLLPSLRQRLAASEDDGVFSFTRPKMDDFNDLKAEAQRRYVEASMSFTAAASANDIYSFVVMTQDTDALTGG